jgi:hypothetical protein
LIRGTELAGTPILRAHQGAEFATVGEEIEVRLHYGSGFKVAKISPAKLPSAKANALLILTLVFAQMKLTLYIQRKYLLVTNLQ